MIFLRPLIIRNPSLSGDYSGYRSQLPGPAFFEQTREAQPLNNFPER